MGQTHTLRALPTPTGRLPKVVRVPVRVKAEWKADGVALGDRGYVMRWTWFWGRVVRACLSYGPVADVDAALIEEYVRRCRLAELHLRKAQADPYQVSETSGLYHAHPGFAQSRAEARAARDVAEALGLTPYLRRRAGVGAPFGEPEPERESEDEGKDEHAWRDDQLGPDGERL